MELISEETFKRFQSFSREEKTLKVKQDRRKRKKPSATTLLVCTQERRDRLPFYPRRTASHHILFFLRGNEVKIAD
jgi:hypothetical protein